MRRRGHNGFARGRAGRSARGASVDRTGAVGREKKRLGLGRRFLNSLRLTWQMSLLAESLVLLRTMAWLDEPQPDGLLSQLQPHQVESDLHLEKLATPENPQITHKSS
jgi:hypothetical protein